MSDYRNYIHRGRCCLSMGSGGRMTDKHLFGVLASLVMLALSIGGYLIYQREIFGWAMVGATIYLLHRGMRGAR
jgi:hypothetical protein